MKSHDNSTNKRFEEYLTLLNNLVGSSGLIEEVLNGDSSFFQISYGDIPDPGCVTVFTYGVSLVKHEAWINGMPEIVMSVNSNDPDWINSLSLLVCSLLGKCPFSFGNILRFGKPITSKTEMSAFFLFWPTILSKEQQLLQLSDRTIYFKQAYPIHSSEIDILERIGAEKFFMIDGIDFTDVERPKCV